MLFLKVIAAIVPVWFASSALADAGRMDRLTNSHLISSLEKDGVWQVSTSEMRMDYSCLRCDGGVSATLEVIAPYTLEKLKISNKNILLNAKFSVRISQDKFL